MKGVCDDLRGLTMLDFFARPVSVDVIDFRSGQPIYTINIDLKIVYRSKWAFTTMAEPLNKDEFNGF